MTDTTADLENSDEGFRLNPIPFYGSAIGISCFAIWVIFFTESANQFIGSAFVSHGLGLCYLGLTIQKLRVILATIRPSARLGATSAFLVPTVSCQRSSSENPAQYLLTPMS